jgi:transcriptional regulator with XRE-family HTH domain
MAITKQQALKKLRENQGLSLREMAKKCGVDKSTISKLERGLIHSLTEETERKLAIGYGIITRVIRRDLCELSCVGIDIDTIRSGKIKQWYDEFGKKPANSKMIEPVDVSQSTEGGNQLDGKPTDS